MERARMFGFIAEKAKALADATADSLTSAGQTLVTTKDAVLDSVGEHANVAIAQADKHWPAVEKILVDGLLSVAHDRLKDDEAFLYAVEKAFELLPAPVRLVLPRGAFIKHSLTHRDSIVAQISAKQADRLLLDNSKSTKADGDLAVIEK